MTRRPKVKECADVACPATFTGRWRYCEFHRAGRDKPGSKFRKQRKVEQQRARRRAEWDARYAKSPLHPEPTTGVKSPLHVSAGQRVAKLGHSGWGPTPIDVARTPGMTVGRAIRVFTVEWDAYLAETGGA